MKLKKWALIAEVVGAAAVVITLIILIVGIRENTDVVRISVYGGLLDSVNDLEVSIAQDPDLSRIYDAWLNRSVASLDNAEAARLALLVVTLFRGYEKAFFAWQYEVIGDTEWSRFDRLICNAFEQIR